MSEQPLDLRRSVLIVRRHKRTVGITAALGLAAGVAFTMLSPPLLGSKALVVLPPSASRFTGTQVVIAGSDPVLRAAMRRVNQPVSLPELRSRVQVASLTPRIISITAHGKTAAEAENTANAVATSYIAYVGSPKIPGGPVSARVLESAITATGTSPVKRLLLTGVLGALLGAVIGAVVALAVGRRDRRLRERDEIADAIGIPVLASIPTGHPSDAAGWTKLLQDYKPAAVHAWGLRKALHHLGLTDVKAGGEASVEVLSLSADSRALALGPQLAAYAASLGIPTELVIGPQQDPNATAALRVACAAPQTTRSGQPPGLWVSVRDFGGGDQPAGAPLTVAVGVVDAQAPRVADTMRASVTVLGVSSGAATAEQLARVAASAADDGRHIAGILVADPASVDHTMGRLPRLTPTKHRRAPTRLSRIATETRR